MPNRIRELREAAGLTLQQVAVRAGTSYQQIYKLEQGKRRLTDEWMRRLAPALGVPVSALFPDLPKERGQLVEDPDELALLRWWRSTDREDRRVVLLLARDKGVQIKAHEARRQRRA